MRRVDFIDIARGIGIILVVIGHTILDGRSYIYSFHIPLFFLISGYLFGLKKDLPDLGWFIKSRFKRLMLPYFAACILFFVLWLTIGKKFSEKATDVSIIQPLLGIFYGNGHGNWLIFNVPLWFFTALFCAEIIFLLVLKSTKDMTQLKTWGIVTLVSFTGIAVSKFAFLPWGLDIAMTVQLLLYIGYRLSKTTFLEHSSTFLQLIAPVLLVAIAYVAVQMNGRIDVNTRVYHNVLAFYLFGASGAIMVLYTAKLLKGAVAALLANIGKETLPILMFHIYAIKAFSAIGGKLLHIPLVLFQRQFWPVSVIAGLLISYAIGKAMHKGGTFSISQVQGK